MYDILPRRKHMRVIPIENKSFSSHFRYIQNIKKATNLNYESYFNPDKSKLDMVDIGTF